MNKIEWLCKARPDGSACNHQNSQAPKEMNHAGNKFSMSNLLCCEKCGRTKRASDIRIERGQL